MKAKNYYYLKILWLSYLKKKKKNPIQVTEKLTKRTSKMSGYNINIKTSVAILYLPTSQTQ